MLSYSLTTLYHVTPTRNVESILSRGLLLSYASNAKVPFLWLDIEPSGALQAHIAKHHKVPIDALTWLAVSFREAHTHRHLHPHCYDGWARKTRRDIAPSAITPLVGLSLLSTRNEVLYVL